ncbi:hypothetical protein JCM10207_005535 [Rhodosporidiobolus poonsookiae]
MPPSLDHDQYLPASSLPSRADPDSAVPSIILSPASPMQPAHSPRTPAQPQQQRVARPASAGGASDSARMKTSASRGSHTEAGSSSAGAGAASRSAAAPTGAAASSAGRRPSSSPSPSTHAHAKSASPSSSSAALPPSSNAAQPSHSRTFFSSLANSIPLPSLPTFNLASFIPNKVPGGPTIQVVHEEDADEDSVEGRTSDEEDEEDGVRRERNGMAMEGKKSMDLRIEQDKMMQQAHYFAPVRPPSPSFLRDNGTSHLADYVASLLPPSYPPYPSKRARSASPGASSCLPSRSYTAPLPSAARSPSSRPTPASSVPFPSLRPPSAAPPKCAATDGQTFVSDSDPRSTSKPSFPSLTRTPSSAFVAASKEGRVHPLTLAAVARRDSEHEALRLVRERKETERRRENSSEEVEGGTAPSAVSGRPPALLRKQSWTAAGQAAARVAGLRSESPTRMSDAEEGGAQGQGPAGSQGSLGTAGRRRREMSALGLGLVEEGKEVPVRQGTDDTAVQPASATSDRSFVSASQGSTPHPATPTSASASTLSGSGSGSGARSVSMGGGAASTLSASTAGEQTARTKRGSFFSRFSRSGRSVSQSSTATAKTATSAAAVPLSPGVGEFGQIPPPTPGAYSVRSGMFDAQATVTGKEKGKDKEERVKLAKVKAKGKSTKDFGRLFLAQELFIPPPPVSPPSSGFRPSASATPDDASSLHSLQSPPLPDNASQDSHAPTEDGAPTRKKKNAVWAVKFSDDGKYLAVGGKDGVVRVWQVLHTPEDRASTFHPSTPSPESTFPPDSPPLSRSGAPPPTPSSTTMPSRKKGSAGASAPKAPVCVMPVFGSRPVREFVGHEADVLDLSWSKNNFLLSSSMDKTVRLWHVSRNECLCAFQHLDFVTSIAFHPKDDRFFLSGSLDCKLRLWNIPEKRVHIWTELPELITSVAFTRDGKLAVAGSFVGVCMFFEVESFRYHSQMAAKSTRGKNSKGKKVTSLCAFPLPSTTHGERLLVTTNDSRMRLYNTDDKTVETKYAGHENTSSQIRASFSDDGRFIISGSEDRHVYIWDSCLSEHPDGGGGFLLHKKHKDGAGYECFPMNAHIVTAAIFAPTPTREHLAAAGDPIFADGHTHVAPLSQTISGATVASVLSTSTSGGVRNGEPQRLVPARSRGGEIRPGGAEDAVLVVADDETGVISIFRNSTIPPPSLVDIDSAATLNGGAAGLKREGSKRWSRS